MLRTYNINTQFRSYNNNVMNINILREINEWWVTGRVRKDFLEPVPRTIIPKILQAMDNRQIILLEGARRVGKTSIIFHLIDELIRQGISSKHLIYISLDDPLIEKEGFFEGLVKIIETYLLENRIHSSRERFYLLYHYRVGHSRYFPNTSLCLLLKPHRYEQSSPC